ncbi:MAG: hypothetical protein JRI79_05665 [Deltaproteobacteria bacterium]|nr:hypothetical protein [Deltaproteobacteria bacterium]MBW1936238.1 hypothetical protein [Deltaproteobacteria bacterium]MBW1977443.1 hypothetical protein [Deltaproteobacteria bacterium]MBW2043475.1 hypothetical protein [Deltaproteobacteria bacterium]MBW2299654.1 hypothetical protein [Deltaproteobacteria bacterium]
MFMIVEVFRYDPDAGKEPYYERYTVHVPALPITVKELLETIAKNYDPSISFFQHSCCNHATCKRCYVKVGGKAVLACNTLVESKDQIRIDPVSHDNVVKDLVVKDL